MYFNLFAKSYCEALGIDFTRTVDAIKFDIEDAKLSKSKKNAYSRNGDGESDEAGQFEPESTTLTSHWMLYSAALIVLICFVIMYSYIYGPKDEDLTETEVQEQIMEESLKTQFAGYDWDAPKYKTAKPITLSLSAKEESWATILTDGDTSIFRILLPDRIYYVEAKYRMQISIGIPRNVSVILNGKEVNLINPETRRISRVKIDQLNINNFLNRMKKEEADNSSPGPDGK